MRTSWINAIEHRIAEATIRRLVIIRHSKPVVLLVALTSELTAQMRRRPIVFALDKAREATAGAWVCCCDAIRRDVGFRPARPLAARLRQTADWYASEGWIRRMAPKKAYREPGLSVEALTNSIKPLQIQ